MFYNTEKSIPTHIQNEIKINKSNFILLREVCDTELLFSDACLNKDFLFKLRYMYLKRLSFGRLVYFNVPSNRVCDFEGRVPHSAL